CLLPRSRGPTLGSPSPLSVPATAPASSTLSLHDALPIWRPSNEGGERAGPLPIRGEWPARSLRSGSPQPSPSWRSCCGCAHRSRSEEHTSELQSRENLVCRLLLEKKKQRQRRTSQSLPQL